MSKFYVYKTFDPETNEYYLGSHTDRYLGGGIWVKNHENRKRLRKSILKRFETRNEARKYEAQLIKEGKHDELCKNLMHHKRYVQRRISCKNKSGLVRFLMQTGTSENDFAKNLGVNVSLVSRWVNGLAKPRVKTAHRIVAVTNRAVTLEDLYA